MKLYGQIAQTALFRILAVFCGVVFTVMTARLLGPEGRGLLATLVTLVSGICIAFHFSLAYIAVQRIGSAPPADKHRLSQVAFGVLTTVLLLSTVITWTVFALLVAAGQLNSRAIPLPILCLGMILIPFLLWEGYSSLLLGAIGRLDADNKAVFAGKLLTLAGGVLLLSAGAGVVGALLATLAGACFSAWMTLLVLVRELGLPRPGRWADVRAYLHDGAKLHFNAVATFLSLGVDVLFVANLASIGSAGVYQVGTQIVSALMIIPASMAAVFYSRTAAVGYAAGWTEKHRLIVWSMLVFTATALALYQTASFWVALLFGAQFFQLNDLVGIQLMTFVFLAFSQIMSPQWVARGFFKRMSAIAVALAVISLLLNAMLVPVWGNVGAALVRLLCAGLGAGINVYMFLRFDAEMKRA